MTVFAAAWAVLRRELWLASRRPGELLQPLMFFLVVVTLFPLGTRPEPELLATMAPAVLWVAALLATLLGLERLFRADHDDGSLEQLLLSPAPLALLTFSKVLAHWLLTGLPLVMLSPMLAIMLGLPMSSIGTVVLSLLLGTPILSLLGSIGAALTVGIRRGGALLALLLLPLYVPTLILGASAVAAVRDGLPADGQLYLLGALLSGALVLAPLASALALRIASE